MAFHESDKTRLVIIPSYNSGSLLKKTVQGVLPVWAPVWTVLDGSTDHSVADVLALASADENLTVLSLAQNEGKGGATLSAMIAARAKGFTHALIMDSDGQHPAAAVSEFMELSRKHPEAMILGVPVFGPEAPPERVKGRRVGNWFADLETLWGGINDSLFGFRLYPLEPAIRIMESISTARRFDFDTELAVRLFWSGVRPINRPVKVYYPDRSIGGVTHFKYLRDNLLLARTHVRLCLQMIPRLRRIWNLRKKWLFANDI